MILLNFLNTIQYGFLIANNTTNVLISDLNKQQTNLNFDINISLPNDLRKEKIENIFPITTPSMPLFFTNNSTQYSISTTITKSNSDTTKIIKSIIHLDNNNNNNVTTTPTNFLIKTTLSKNATKLDLDNVIGNEDTTTFPTTKTTTILNLIYSEKSNNFKITLK